MENQKDIKNNGGISAHRLFQNASRFDSTIVFPAVSVDTDELETENYAGRAALVMSALLPELTGVLQGITSRAYGEEDEYAELAKIDDGLCLLELCNENRLTYRDISFSVMPDLIEAASRIIGDDRKTLVLAADKAAYLATARFSQKDGVSVAAFYPKNEGTIADRLLARCAKGELNAAPVAIDEEAAADELLYLAGSAEINELSEKNGVKLVVADHNSLFEVIPLTVVFFSAYCDLVSGEEIEKGDEVIFAIPEGRKDLLYAGCCAHNMGLPIKLVYAGEQFGKCNFKYVYYAPVTHEDKTESLDWYFEEYGIAAPESTLSAISAFDKYAEVTGDCSVAVIISPCNAYTDADYILESLGEIVEADESDSARKIESMTAIPIPERIKRLSVSEKTADNYADIKETVIKSIIGA